MTRVALYARYSSERQNERSIADQVALLSAHAAKRGWDVVAVHSDAAISGTAIANRPGLLNALAAAERGEWQVLLVEDVDRIARNREHDAHVYNRLTRAGVALATLSSDAVSVVESGVKGLLSELYVANLSQKTKRGMHANAESGLATGSRLFGYRSAPGGKLAVVEEEAAVVRRVFARYAAGDTPRAIAAALNRDGVPGPRGGAWNASTINGSRQRGNGLLHSEIYAGVKVWNRVAMTKDPDTGRRISRPRPESEWRRTPVPELAIVDDATWAAVRERKDREAGVRLVDLRRRPWVFSGLFRCGLCGGAFTVYSKGKLACTARIQQGTCANSRTPSRAGLEARVLDGLRERLLAPELVAAYVRAYHAAWTERRDSREARRAPVARKLAEATRGVERIVDAIVRGTATPAIEARLVGLEAEKATLAAELAAIEGEAEPPVELHPRAADRYAARVADLQAALEAAAGSTDDVDAELVAAVRALVDRIDVVPLNLEEKRGGVDLVLHGRLAAFIQPMGKPARSPGGLAALVAGGGIEPPTCGL